MRFRHWITTSALLAASATTLVACCNESPDDGDTGGEGGTPPATGVALSMQMSYDVAGFDVAVTRVSCNGEAYRAFSQSFPSALLDLSISSKVTADGSPHSFADTFIPLEAGCYDVITQPLKSDGTLSADCAIVGTDKVVVLDGLPTDLLLISQCVDPEAVLLLNHPPQLVNIWYPQGKFVAHCDHQQICAQLKDPDGDPLEVVWSKLAGLPSTTFTVLSSVPNLDGSITHCVDVTHGGVEMMMIEAKAYDLMKYPNGLGLIRFEQFYANNGIPSTSHDSFQFQGYGASSASCPCVPQPEICDGVDNNCDGHSDEGLAGCACVPGDQSACYTGPPGTGGVGTCLPGVKVCLPDGSGFGACQKEVLPKAEVCGDGADNDCDGAVDNGCECAPGVTQPCYPGSAGTKGVGVCVLGTQTCLMSSTWGACVGAGAPSAEICGDGLDNDCDAKVDESSQCPCNQNGTCDPGETTASCPQDCPPAVCGDGVCEAGESCTDCPGDCGACACANGNGHWAEDW